MQADSQTLESTTLGVDADELAAIRAQLKRSKTATAQGKVNRSDVVMNVTYIR